VRFGFPAGLHRDHDLRTDHATLGAELLRTWNMPAEIVDAVAFHHNPEATESALAGILNLAEEDALNNPSASPNNSTARENLWGGMRRAAAARLTGIHGISRHELRRKSSILAIAS
jgi:HD-like signal output (HDOD) protein